MYYYYCPPKDCILIPGIRTDPTVLIHGAKHRGKGRFFGWMDGKISSIASRKKQHGKAKHSGSITVST